MKIKKDLWWVSVSGSLSHPTTLSASPTQLLVGQLTRLPFHSGYATVSPLNYIPGYDPAYRLRSLTCSGEVVFEDRENI